MYLFTPTHTQEINRSRYNRGAFGAPWIGFALLKWNRIWLILTMKLFGQAWRYHSPLYWLTFLLHSLVPGWWDNTLSATLASPRSINFWKDVITRILVCQGDIKAKITSKLICVGCRFCLWHDSVESPAGFFFTVGLPACNRQLS